MTTDILLGACADCRHWQPEPRHRLWGRCGRTDDAMRYGAITEYPYDVEPSKRVRLSPFDNRGRISTYKSFGCNRHEPKSALIPAGSKSHE